MSLVYKGVDLESVEGRISSVLLISWALLSFCSFLSDQATNSTRIDPTLVTKVTEIIVGRVSMETHLNRRLTHTCSDWLPNEELNAADL